MLDISMLDKSAFDKSALPKCRLDVELSISSTLVLLASEIEKIIVLKLIFPNPKTEGLDQKNLRYQAILT